MIKTILICYFVVAIILATISLITNYKKLRNLSKTKIILFFLCQPMLILREILKK